MSSSLGLQTFLQYPLDYIYCFFLQKLCVKTTLSEHANQRCYECLNKASTIVQDDVLYSLLSISLNRFSNVFTDITIDMFEL